MTIRRPTERVQDIRDSVFDIIDFISTGIKFEVKQLDVTAVPSSYVTVTITSDELNQVFGAVQINSTTAERSWSNYNNTRSVDVSWYFGASTSGKQTVTFLLIGS